MCRIKPRWLSMECNPRPSPSLCLLISADAGATAAAQLQPSRYRYNKNCKENQAKSQQVSPERILYTSQIKYSANPLALHCIQIHVKIDVRRLDTITIENPNLSRRERKSLLTTMTIPCYHMATTSASPFYSSKA